jgi:ubiquinone/menaquinone biosynthesis C-methylase UbiE
MLTGGTTELAQMQIQAQAWQSDAECLLDQVGIQPGWRCIDLGCGSGGILASLSDRVGPQGQVIGIDWDTESLIAAETFAQRNQLQSVQLLARDAHCTGLPRESFDLTHARFLFTPVGRDSSLLQEMMALTRPGGIVAIQEPDTASWLCYPFHPVWVQLKEVVLAAFRCSGHDFNAGRRTFSLLKRAGLEDVHIRAATIALSNHHPYQRLLIQLAQSLRQTILDAELLTEAELNAAIADCERIVSNPEAVVVSFTVAQVWGRKPGG